MGNDYLCDLLQLDLCSCGLDIHCDNCPFNKLFHTPFDSVQYLEEIQERIKIALSMLKD